MLIAGTAIEQAPSVGPFVDSSTLSRLFDSNCMNLYGRQLFRYNDIYTNMELLYVTWRESISKIWKYHLDIIVIYYITLTVVIPLTTLRRNVV